MGLLGFISIISDKLGTRRNTDKRMPSCGRERKNIFSIKKRIFKNDQKSVTASEPLDGDFSAFVLDERSDEVNAFLYRDWL